MWQRVMPALGKDGLLDEGMPKPRGEILVFGKAFSPGGEPRPAFAAGLEVGPVDRPSSTSPSPSSASGDGTSARRRSRSRSPRCRSPGKNAFGGPDYALNPKGDGARARRGARGQGAYLPHLEDPRQLLLKSPGRQTAARGLRGPRPHARARGWPSSARTAASGSRTTFPASPGSRPRVLPGRPGGSAAARVYRGRRGHPPEEPAPGAAAHRDPLPEAPRPVLRAAAGRGGRGGDRRRGAPPGGRDAPGDGAPLSRHRARRRHLPRRRPRSPRTTPPTCACCSPAWSGPTRRGRSSTTAARWSRRLDKEKGHLHALREQELLPGARPRRPVVPGRGDQRHGRAHPARAGDGAAVDLASAARARPGAAHLARARDEPGREAPAGDQARRRSRGRTSSRTTPSGWSSRARSSRRTPRSSARPPRRRRASSAPSRGSTSTRRSRRASARAAARRSSAPTRSWPACASSRRWGARRARRWRTFEAEARRPGVRRGPPQRRGERPLRVPRLRSLLPAGGSGARGEEVRPARRGRAGARRRRVARAARSDGRRSARAPPRGRRSPRGAPRGRGSLGVRSERGRSDRRGARAREARGRAAREGHAARSEPRRGARLARELRRGRPSARRCSTRRGSRRRSSRAPTSPGPTSWRPGWRARTSAAPRRTTSSSSSST